MYDTIMVRPTKITAVVDHGYTRRIRVVDAEIFIPGGRDREPPPLGFTIRPITDKIRLSSTRPDLRTFISRICRDQWEGGVRREVIIRVDAK